MAEQKDAGALIRLAYQGLKKLKLDADAVLIESGLNPEQLYDTQLRTPHWAQSLFWQQAETVSNDPLIGLHLGQQMPLLKGLVLEYLFISSNSFGEGLQRMLNYQRLISDAIQLELHQEGNQAYLSFSYPDQELRHLIECSALVCTQFLNFVSEESFVINRIDFQHQAGAAIEDYQDCLGVELRFSCAENRLYFDPEVLSFRSLHTRPELLNLHEKLASAQLEDLKRQDLVSDVQHTIARQLESGESNISDIARELNVPVRSLRQHLLEAGTSFSQILNDYRHRFAKRLLANTDESIAEIVYLTGFAEPSTFYRAFKRWEGMTPIDYRKSKRDS